jgi:hypothetical protein
MESKVLQWIIRNYVIQFYVKISYTKIVLVRFCASSLSHLCCVHHSIPNDVYCCVGQFITFPIYVSVDLVFCCSFETFAPWLAECTFLLLSTSDLPLLYCFIVATNIIFFILVLLSLFLFYISRYNFFCVWLLWLFVSYNFCAYVWVCRYDCIFYNHTKLHISSVIFQLFSSSSKLISYYCRLRCCHIVLRFEAITIKRT